MHCVFKRHLFCRSKRKQSDNVSIGSQKRRNFGDSYVEHHLSLEELCEIYQGLF